MARSPARPFVTFSGTAAATATAGRLCLHTSVRIVEPQQLIWVHNKQTGDTNQLQTTCVISEKYVVCFCFDLKRFVKRT